MKFKLLIVNLLLFTSVASFAQKGIDDGSKYGKGEDSVRCVLNLNVLSDNIKVKNFPDAEKAFHVVFTECPKCNPNIYLYGTQIYMEKIKNEKDAEKRKVLVAELLNIYDMRIKYFGTHSKYPEGQILADKAAACFNFTKDKTPEVYKNIYEWTTKSMDLMKERTKPTTLTLYLAASDGLMKADTSLKAQFVKDYLKVTDILDKMDDQFSHGQGPKDEKMKASIDGAKSFATELFAKSGVADCETLIAIYEPKLEENKENEAFLKQMLSLLRKSKCNESEVYFKASTYMHAIKPSSESAAGLSSQAIRQENFDKAITFLDEAFNLETNDEDKAEYAFRSALLYEKKGNYSKARDLARVSAKLRPNNGHPFVMIARLYATTAKDIYPSDPVKQRAVYYAAVDKLYEAKKVDPEYPDIDKLIGQYSSQFPSKEDVFMHNELESGKAITVGGWIQERTTCR